MKKRTLCSLVLAGAIVASAVAPVGALAVEDSATNLNSQGKVEFRQDDDGTNPDVDPEDPYTPVDPPYTPNPNKAALMIDGVTPLDFKIQKGVVSDAYYFAENVEVKYPAGHAQAGEVIGKRGNYIQLTDRRLDSDTVTNRTPWTLTAKLDQQFQNADASSVLNGSTLTFTNPVLETATELSAADMPKIVTSSFVLRAGDAAVDVLKAETANAFGTYTLEFGHTAEYAAANPGLSLTAGDTTGTAAGTDATVAGAGANKIENGSVQLYVPGNIAKKATVYTAKVLWSLTAGA